jgi:hypothetical protein
MFINAEKMQNIDSSLEAASEKFREIAEIEEDAYNQLAKIQ